VADGSLWTNPGLARHPIRPPKFSLMVLARLLVGYQLSMPG